MTKIEENKKRARLKNGRRLTRSMAALKDKGGAETQVDSLNPPFIEETNGPKDLDPTRYGDWERKGRCIDF